MVPLLIMATSLVSKINTRVALLKGWVNSFLAFMGQLYIGLYTNGMSLIEAARVAGWRVHDTVTRLMRRFNERGLAALDDLPRSGHPRSYGPRERARIEQELQRSPDLKEDGTATWSLTTLQRTLREAPDGLPEVSTFTILHTIHEAGYTWQKNRTWCKTGFTLHKTN